MKRSIIGDAVLFVGATALLACSTAGPEENEACSTVAPGAMRAVCNGDDEILECKEGKWKKHVPNPGGMTCSCPEGDETRDASCMSAGFVGIAKSGRARPRGQRVRRG